MSNNACDCGCEIKKWPREPASKRFNITRKLTISGVDIFFSVGVYDNGEPCEIFINVNKEGTTIRGLLDCLGVAVSLGLQYGVPLEKFISFFSGVSFDPSGIVIGGNKIKRASSIVDALFRLLGKEYIDESLYDDENEDGKL